MKRAVFGVILIATMLVAMPRVLAAAPVAAKTTKPAISATAQKYATRVRLIDADLQSALAAMWTTFAETETVLSDLSRRTRNETEADEKAQRARFSELQNDLRGQIEKVRVQARRLRGVSPVPRPLKKADDRLVGASLNFERGLDAMARWLRFPVDEVKNNANRLLRKAEVALEGALQETARKTDPAIRNKVYTAE